VVAIVNDVKSEAKELKAANLARAQTNFPFTLVLSIVCGSPFVIALVSVWRNFGQVYVRRMVASYPEVIN